MLCAGEPAQMQGGTSSSSYSKNGAVPSRETRTPAPESRAKKHGHHHGKSHENDTASVSVPIPLFPSDDGALYALHSGITHDRRLCKRQHEAYLSVQHKIVERQDKARAIVISANVLSLSVMASQLAMYRWKVTEAQTVTEAVTILQTEVTDAERRSYRVARTKAKPLSSLGVSKEKGKTSQKKRRRGSRDGHSKYAAAVAAVGSGPDAEEALKKIFAKKVARSMRKREKEGAAATAAADTDEGAADFLHRKAERDGLGKSSAASSGSSSSTGSSASSSTAGSDSDDSDKDSVCSAEVGHLSNAAKADAANVTPADAITRLVIVDCFTHEPFTDIIEHIRFMDKLYGLELVIVLLLPQSELQQQQPQLNASCGGASAMAPGVADVQGPGSVITPQYDMSLDAAYQCGYDLVLTHYIDHVVVDFLTETFVSSAGRWRNDVRAKAAVGNYVSLKNVLLGRIDIDALKQLVWNEGVDDAELLEAIGTNTLALQGETKSYALAGQKLSEQQQQQQQKRPKSNGHSGNGADVLTIIDDDAENQRSATAHSTDISTQSIFPSSLPHLRSKNVNQTGVRQRGGNDNGERFLPLADLDAQHDVLGAVMTPASNVQHTVLRKRRGRLRNGEDDEGSPEDSIYDTFLVDEASENHAVYMEAIESEMARLIAENDGKQSSIDLMEGEVERLHKTVAVLRRKLGAGADDPLGAGGGGAGGDGGGGSRSYGRPDSGSLVNLTKEQQIYILKERLEAANERILGLMEGEDGGRRPRSGANGQGRRRQDKSASAADACRVRLQRQRKQKAILTYNEHREEELLKLHDVDADWLAAMQVIDDGTSDLTESRRGDRKRAGGDVEAAARKREDEHKETDAAMNALRDELLYLRQAGDDDASDALRRAITSQRLEEALDRLGMQKQRIQSLEELKKIDDAMYERKIDQLKLLAARAASAGASREAPKVKKGAGKRTARTTSNAPLAAAGTRPAATKTALPTAEESAAEKEVVQKLKTKHAKELAALEARLTSEKEAAVLQVKEDEGRQLRRKLRECEAAAQAQLAKLYLRIRKPHTAAYKSLLESDYTKAMQEERGALHRLHFALNGMAPSAQREVDENGEALSGPVARIADPAMRQRMAQLAREHAHHALKASIAKQALEAFEKETNSAEAQAEREELLSLREAQGRLVADAEAHDVDLGHYLEEQLRLCEIEDRLSCYGEVDCSPALRHPQAWRAVSSTAATTPAATGGKGEEDVNIVATVADGGGGVSSVPLHDAHGLLLGIVDVFQSAFEGVANISLKSRRSKRGSSLIAGDKKKRKSTASSAAASEGVLEAGAEGREESDSESSDEEEQDTRESDSARRRRALAVAVASAVPTGAVISRQQDTMIALRQSGASQALKELYEVAQSAFAAGYMHPDRMADIDKHVCLEKFENTKVQSGAGSPPSNSAAASSPSTPLVTQTAELYLAHRQELLRMLRLLVLAEPFLDPVVTPFTDDALNGRVEADVLMACREEAPQPVVTLPLLVAADTAIVGSVVDLMGTGMGEVVVTDNEDAGEDAVPSSPTLTNLSGVLRARSLRHLSPTCEQVTSYTVSRTDVLHALQSAQGPGRRLLGQKSGGDPAIAEEAAAAAVGDIEEIMTQSRNLFSEDDKAFLRQLTQQSAGEYTAEDLAQMFSRRRREPGKAAGLSLEEIYLEDGDGSAAEDEGDKTDENLAAVRGILRELSVLNATRRKRMEELVQRYRLHQQELLHEGGTKKDGEAEVPHSPREVPDFEVKSGSAAWYGMEAAKRVKDILRRRAKPGQIVVGGGPDGGDVGVELSRRTAFPLPPRKEEVIMQTAQERLRAAHIALPPLKRRGLSRWQQHRYGAGAAEESAGYVYPRDEASINAYGTVASQCEFDCVDRFMETPFELTDRVMQYRATVSRAVSRLGTGGNPAIAASLGPPYYTPIIAGTGTSTSSRVGSESQRRQYQQPSLGATAWTYGVPTERVHEMLANPVPDADGSAAVLFLPHRSHSSLAERKQPTSTHRQSSPSPAFLAQRAPGPLPPSLSSFLAGASTSSPYASPAALAAQHLSALLRMSMADPTVGGGGFRNYQTRQRQVSAASTAPPPRPSSEFDGTLPPSAFSTSDSSR